MTRAAATRRKDKVGEVLYDRGVINAMYDLEAIRTAQEKFGKKPLTGEQMQWGYEHLDMTPQRLAALGFEGLVPPVKLSCEDHKGNGNVRIIQWDGQAMEVRVRLDPAAHRCAARAVQGIGAEICPGEGHQAARLRIASRPAQ